MSERQTTTPQSTGYNRMIALLLSAYLIATFLWRALTDGHEYPMRTEQVMEIAFDVLALIGLIGMKAKIPAALFWIALAAGVGLLAIRLHSDASWWTGHWNYSLRPR